MKQPTDGPPILFFLTMFTGLLAIAVCLAALAQFGEPAPISQADRAVRMAASSGSTQQHADGAMHDAAATTVAGSKPNSNP